MKIFLLLLLTGSFFHIANGQVGGKVVSSDGTLLPLANVTLLRNTDSSLVKSSLTNEKGMYFFDEVSEGEYLIRVTTIGYQVFYSTFFDVTTTQRKIALGTFVMKEDKKQLDEVVVRAEKPLFQQRPEGIIVNAENSILTKGSSALQVLERSPGVVINLRDNSISLNGKSGVTVMLNGKLIRMSMEQLVSMLNGMSADNISTIELLTTPPAKYDAEGSAGIINIVLKKNKIQGTYGNFSVTGGYSKGEKATAGFNLSHNTKYLSIYGSYTYSHNKTYTDMFVESSQHMPFLGGDVYMTGTFDTKALSNNHDATIGMDIKVNSKLTVGVSVTNNQSFLSGATVSDAGYNVLPDSLLQFNSLNKGGDHWNNLINSVYLEKTMRRGGKINISADWLYFKNTDEYMVQSSFINQNGIQAGDSQILFAPVQKGNANTVIQVGVLKMDYSKQLSTKIKLEAGVKGAYTQSTSLSGIQSQVNGTWVSSDQTSNHIIMNEGISAGYASLNTQINASASFTIGASYEYSYTNMDNSKNGTNIANRKLGSLFPSLFFLKKLNDNSEVQVSYTKRISRPSYNDLASYVGYSDPTAVYTGNPFLQPTITNNIKLGYNYKSYSFSLLLSRDDNAISRYQLTESPLRDILYISPQNLTWQNYLTFQTTLPFKINDWWNMSYSFAGGPRQYKVAYTRTPFVESYFGYSLNFNQVFKLPHNFSTEISGFYNSTSYNGTQEVNGFGVLNAGINKELKNNVGSLQLSVSDILMKERYNIHYGKLTEEAFSIKNFVSVKPESAMFPVIKLTYSRSFGGGANDQKKTGSGAQEEKERIRN